jgi:regulation of enolase protein 1 (concanavalin A-like superfamily)
VEVLQNMSPVDLKFDVSKLTWLNKPEKFEITGRRITIATEPQTDFWQKTYYGFSNDNGHALTQPVSENFTFIVKTSFEYKNLYDQCGVVIYQDSDNWFKGSFEYENKHYSRLGSVVTNLGYSDWATTDISSDIHEMWYRLSRSGQDFLIENSSDGAIYKQMRIFHMNKAIETANIGIYACSPLKSSFDAVFTGMEFVDCMMDKAPH